MKKGLIFGFCFLLCLLSCKKESSSSTTLSSTTNSSTSSGDFIEISINNKTYKSTTIGLFGFESDPSSYNLYQNQTGEYEIEVNLVFRKFYKDFKDSKVGNYRMIGDYPINVSYDENLDLAIIMGSSSKYQPFELQAGSTHVVNKIIDKGSNNKGQHLFNISGTFSGVFKDNENQTSYNINGKYSYTLQVLE